MISKKESVTFLSFQMYVIYAAYIKQEFNYLLYLVMDS